MRRPPGFALATRLGAGLLLLGTCGTADAQTVHTGTGCPNCHQLHGATGSTLTNYAISEDLCLSCHTDGANPNAPSGVSTHLSPKYVANDSAATCVRCHGHRGSTSNLALIRASIATPNSGTRTVLFTSRGTDAVAGTWPSTLPGAGTALNSFADGNTTYDGVCEVCHTQTTNHQNGTVLPDNSNHGHNAGLQCTRCHLHSSGFKGGGPCAACHDTGGQGTSGPNSRRAIIPEMSRASHHVGSTYADNDCRTCHDMSQHQQGTVRLKNQDDTTTVYALAGNPLTDSAVARTLTPFCLSCHDGSAGGRPKPFSDSVVVPVIDTAKWRLAAHKTAAPVAGCFGDGSFGCHGTAHGSQKAKLLGLQPAASPDSGATPGYYQEEGSCFNCHDTNGPSSKDLQTPFSAAIKWVTAAVGASANTRLNDRHDVQYAAQSTSGSKIECTDCHNPHADKSAQPVKTDPDPADGRVPGTGQVMAGASFMTEFCLDCHDGSYPGTVTAPTTALTNIRTTHLTDAMGAGTGAASLKSGYGWAAGDTMPCLACHKPHVSGNLFHGVDTVYSKDGSTAVPPTGGGSYAITDNNIKNTSVNGWKWCNTCHNNSMGSAKTNCFECHYHGSGRW